jgi:hypothetical protein
MAGFGATVKVEEEKEVQEEKPTKSASAPKLNTNDPFAHLRNEEANMIDEKITHHFVGICGHDGTGKSGMVLDAFNQYMQKNPDAELHSIDFDMGVAMLNSAITNNPNIKSWKAWQMGVTDRTAYDYPGTHQRVMEIIRYILQRVEREGAPVWGVLISGIDSWLEVCTNNMRIIDLGLAKDGIEAADNRGAGEAKRVERQSDWAIRNTRFHQLTALSRSLVRAGVRVYWETHLRNTNFSYNQDSSSNTSWQPEWEKKTNNYLPTIIWTEQELHYDDEGELIKTEYKARFHKCKTNPALQDQVRTIFVTQPDGEPQWFGLPELYDGSL